MTHSARCVPAVGAPRGDRAARLRDRGPRCLASAAGLGELTPQQREIIGLAAQGLTNREIAQRLPFPPDRRLPLAPVLPKLGIAGRLQLHGLLAQADHRG